MASSSSSAPTPTLTTRNCTYDVFLSFRGFDTRQNFTGHLYDALTRMGVITYMDDRELEKGGVIADELPKAIEVSMFTIVVLSPNYATSGWCLDELHKILHCMEELSVFPVFYGVEASHVRYQKGSFEEAFKKHQQRFGHDSDKVQRWRAALAQVAGYSGWDSKDQSEATLVKIIARHIHKKVIQKLPSCTKNLVGISERVEKVVRLMDIGSKDVVRFVGIWGMGGIGKTTLARVVYEAIQSQFEVTCFLASVTENHEKNGSVHIQKQLVAQMNISAFDNEYDGRRTIQHSLCNKKVLLVLDDVSKEIQLKNLADEQGWFGPGSRIIITTRNIQLLKTHGVHEIYDVERLPQNEARRLLCLKAFKQDEPKDGYFDLCEEVIKHTNALPLALEVLGSHLYGKSAGVWHSTIGAINSAPYSEILEQLEISYDGLGDLEKNIFLDIACFFKGMLRDEVTSILEKCGYNAESGIDTLIDRSLLTSNLAYPEYPNNYYCLEMHDLLQEMGRNIVNRESRNPSEHSRLWSRKDVDNILTKHMGSAKIESIVLHSRDFGNVSSWSHKAFSNMSMLTLLKISCDVELPSGLDYLPSSLKVLNWHYFPLKTLPLAEDEQYDLVEIVMEYNSIEQLCQGGKVLEKLECSRMIDSRKLKQTPDLSRLPSLKVLCLAASRELTDVHPSITHHKNLVELDLHHCERLKTLPGKLEMSSLKELKLNECSNFENLPEFGECMKHLSLLDLSGTRMRELPASIGYLVGLERLNIKYCTELVCLPHTIIGLKSLKFLDASGCSNLGSLSCLEPSVLKLPSLVELNLSDCGLTEESFPHSLLDLPSLTHLNLQGNDLVSIPIHELPKLKDLNLSGCQKLVIFPKFPSSVRSVKAWECESLDASKFNILSKVSSFYASSGRSGDGLVLQMVISGSVIPSFFVHREEGNCISVPHCPPNERMGIALCFQLEANTSKLSLFRLFASRRISLMAKLNSKVSFSLPSPYGTKTDLLYIVFCTNYNFIDEFHQNNCFELLLEGDHSYSSHKILRSGARWVCIKDIEDLNKNDTERPENKTKVFGLSKSVEEME